MEREQKHKKQIGSAPSKNTYGNTPDKPGNIKVEVDASSKDKISRGAHQNNLSQGNAGRKLDKK